MRPEEDGRREGWTFLTNHARVLACVARDPYVRMRTVAQCTGITERAVQKLISELVDAGYLTRHRLGRRNFYDVHPDLPLRHPLERNHTVGEILAVLLDRAEDEGPAAGDGAEARPVATAWRRRGGAGDGAAGPSPPYGEEDVSAPSAGEEEGSSRRSRSAAARRARSPRRS